MAFQNPINCTRYPDQWQILLEEDRSIWRSIEPNGELYFQQFNHMINHQLEVKALAVFTIAYRLIKAIRKLPDGENWKPIFLEASVLLFPMIEIIGLARAGSGNTDYRLWAGLEWLVDPNNRPAANRPDNIRIDMRPIPLRPMQDHSNNPIIRDIFFTRNYFMHGFANHGDTNTVRIENILNYELAREIPIQAEYCMKVYWNQLKEDPPGGTWITNLANANIHPLILSGSEIYENGLLDPDMLNFLES